MCSLHLSRTDNIIFLSDWRPSWCQLIISELINLKRRWCWSCKVHLLVWTSRPHVVRGMWMLANVKWLVPILKTPCTAVALCFPIMNTFARIIPFNDSNGAIVLMSIPSNTNYGKNLIGYCEILVSRVKTRTPLTKCTAYQFSESSKMLKSTWPCIELDHGEMSHN